MAAAAGPGGGGKGEVLTAADCADEVRRRHRPGKEEALEHRTAEIAKGFDLSATLDPLRQDGDVEPAAEPAPSFQGLLQEGEHIMRELKQPEILQAALIAAAQAVEHWEIATYGTLRAWAEILDEQDAVDLLQETLEEEKKTDRILSEIAMEGVNEEAAAEGSDSERPTVGDGGATQSARGASRGSGQPQAAQRRRGSQKEQRRS